MGRTLFDGRTFWGRTLFVRRTLWEEHFFFVDATVFARVEYENPLCTARTPATSPKFPRFQ